MLKLQPSLLERAAEIVGGEEALCQRLHLSKARLRVWKRQADPLPIGVFLALVDIVLQDDVARAAADRRHAPRSATGPNQGKPREEHAA